MQQLPKLDYRVFYHHNVQAPAGLQEGAVELRGPDWLVPVGPVSPRRSSYRISSSYGQTHQQMCDEIVTFDPGNRERSDCEAPLAGGSLGFDHV